MDPGSGKWGSRVAVVPLLAVSLSLAGCGGGSDPGQGGLVSVSNSLSIDFNQVSGSGYFVGDLVVFRVDDTPANETLTDITSASNVVVGGVWGTYGDASTKTGYVTQGLGLSCGPDVDAHVGESVNGEELLSGTIGDGIWSFQYVSSHHEGPGDSYSYYTSGAVLTALQPSLIADETGSHALAVGDRYSFADEGTYPMIVREAPQR